MKRFRLKSKISMQKGSVLWQRKQNHWNDLRDAIRAFLHQQVQRLREIAQDKFMLVLIIQMEDEEHEAIIRLPSFDALLL